MGPWQAHVEQDLLGSIGKPWVPAFWNVDIELERRRRLTVRAGSPATPVCGAAGLRETRGAGNSVKLP